MRLAHIGLLVGTLLYANKSRAETRTDFGVTNVALARLGYASGLNVGGGVVVNYRDSRGIGFDFLEVDVFARIDRPSIGFRISPFNFLFPLWGNRFWDGGYLRWNLIDLGGDYGSGRSLGENDFTFGTAVSIGYSYTLSSGIALRLFEVGGFVSGVAPGGTNHGDAKILFDGGLTFGAGVTFR